MKKLLIVVVLVLFVFSSLAMALEKGDVYCESVPEAYISGYILTVNGVRIPATGIIAAVPDPDKPGFARLVWSAKNLDDGDKTITAKAVNSWDEVSDDSVPLSFVRPANAAPAGMTVKK